MLRRSPGQHQGPVAGGRPWLAAVPHVPRREMPPCPRVGRRHGEAGQKKLPRTPRLPWSSFACTQPVAPTTFNSAFKPKPLPQTLALLPGKKKKIALSLYYLKTENWPKMTHCCYLTLTLTHSLACSFMVKLSAAPIRKASKSPKVPRSCLDASRGLPALPRRDALTSS